MRILFAAAGTAGHVNPAIALAEVVKRSHAEAEFLFLVTPSGMEKELIENAGYQTVTVEVRGIQRRLTCDNLRAICLFFRAGRHVRKIIAEWKPDLIIGTGGYMSYPAVSAGKSMGVPCILHESNAVPGLAVRLLAKKADLILGGFPTVGDRLPRRCHFRYVGTPVRRAFSQTTRAQSRSVLGIKDGEFLIVSVGGSLGAQQLNRTIIESFGMLYQSRCCFSLIMSTGKRFYDDCVRQIGGLGEAAQHIHPFPYIRDMATALTAADLVISRGGAATITELSAVGAAAVIVPYPAAAADHQTKNATAYEKIGACSMIPETELTPGRLASCIRTISENIEVLRQMRNNARNLQLQNRDKVLISLIEDTVRK